MKILGINSFHPDSSACIVIDGQIIVAIEEERLRRIKHWAGFPSKSIQACLDEANLKFDDLDHIAINRDPNVHLAKKILFTLKKRPSLMNIVSRIRNRKEVGNIHILLAKELSVDKTKVEDKIFPIEHHLAHLSSTYFTSPFNEAVILSVDGFGDFISTMWGLGKENDIKVDDYVTFPHSLGLLYSAITQYLGFWKYGDEYKVMGMAAYGNPNMVEECRELVKAVKGGKFELNTEYFLHDSDGVSMEFAGGYPEIGKVYSDKLVELLGPARVQGEDVDERHRDIASSLQLVYEEVLIHILGHLNRIYPGQKKICLAGGCAQNSLANGIITSKTDFNDVWIQPAAGDSGGALGAALAVSNMIKKERKNLMNTAALGISYDNNEIKQLLKSIDLTPFEHNYYSKEHDLLKYIVENLIKGKVIGFFHGAFEWGPRALGNRSIIVDPRINDMKDLLNEKIKKRESFRPFAPSVLREEVKNWFERDEDVPFMTHVFKIKKEKRKKVPAITHFDGTGRLQTVTKEFNLRYYNLINMFFEKTAVPMILNTSFNENEPIVNTPKEALDCFLRTKMDVIVLENDVISRK